MQIYLEEAMLINACMYLSFLIIISYAFHFKLHKTKSVIGSLLSSLFLIIFSSTKSYILSFCLQTITVLFLITFSFKNLNVKKLIQSLILFTIVSNIFNGILSNKFITSINGTLIYSPVPILAFLLLLIAFTILIRKALDIIIFKAKSTSNICKIKLKFNNKQISTNGYLDTGNNLTFNNKPVSIINFKTFSSLTGISLTNFIAKNYKLENHDYVEVTTITGSKKMLTFELEEIKIKNKNSTLTIKNPNVAISMQFNNLKDYDVILNNYYLN